MPILRILTAIATQVAASWLWTWARPERLMLLGGAILCWIGVTIMYWPAGLIVLGMVFIYLAREATPNDIG
jgi:hypothetical protein